MQVENTDNTVYVRDRITLVYYALKRVREGRRRSAKINAQR